MKGKLKPKTEVHGIGGDTHTSWGMDAVLKEYDGMISKLMAESNTWRIVGMCAVALFAAVVVLLIVDFNKPKTDLIVIGVNDVGEAKYYGSVKGKSFSDYEYTENAIKKMLETFIKGYYTISTDEDLMYENLNECCYYLDTNRRETFVKEVNQKDPFSSVGIIKRNASIDTVIPITKESYQIEWYVTESNLNGERKKVEHYRGVFSLKKISVEKYKKLKDQEKIYNPYGMYITDYSIQKVRIEEFN